MSVGRCPWNQDDWMLPLEERVKMKEETHG
jgi:hypothetical protein